MKLRVPVPNLCKRPMVLHLSSGWNVITGANGTGKTHILRCAQAALASFLTTYIPPENVFRIALRWRQYCDDIDANTIHLCEWMERPPLDNQDTGMVKILAFLENEIPGVEAAKVEAEPEHASEGYSRLAVLIRLIRSGSILPRVSTIIWDLPETALSPRLIRVLIQALDMLVKLGVRVIIATHSLFLMREVHLLRPGPTKGTFIGLKREGGVTTLAKGRSFDDIGDIEALDEDLAQSDRYMDHEIGVE